MCCVSPRRICAPGWTVWEPVTSVWRSRRAAPSTAPWGSAWLGARRATSAWWLGWRPKTSAGAPWMRSNRARCTTAGVNGGWRKRRTACAFIGESIRRYKVGLKLMTILSLLFFLYNKRLNHSHFQIWIVKFLMGFLELLYEATSFFVLGPQNLQFWLFEVTWI